MHSGLHSDAKVWLNNIFLSHLWWPHLEQAFHQVWALGLILLKCLSRGRRSCQPAGRTAHSQRWMLYGRLRGEEEAQRALFQHVIHDAGLSQSSGERNKAKGNSQSNNLSMFSTDTLPSAPVMAPTSSAYCFRAIGAEGWDQISSTLSPDLTPRSAMTSWRKTFTFTLMVTIGNKSKAKHG